MDGRISLGFLASALAFLVSGCVTTDTQKNAPIPEKSPGTASVTSVKSDDTPWPKRDPNRKRDPLPGTEIAYGRMKEAEAEAPSHKNDPEVQARLRDDARKAYQKAIEIDKNNIEAQRHLGRLYVKMGDTDRALEVYKKAMTKHAKEGCIWYDMGLCHTRRKDFAESVRCFTKALELEPENRDYMKMLGLTLAWVGQLEQGLAQMTRAQGASLAHYNVARIMQQKGQVELAKQHLHLSLNANAQFEEARQLLADLERPVTAAAPGGALLGPQ